MSELDKKGFSESSNLLNKNKYFNNSTARLFWNMKKCNNNNNANNKLNRKLAKISMKL